MASLRTSEAKGVNLMDVRVWAAVCAVGIGLAVAPVSGSSWTVTQVTDNTTDDKFPHVSDGGIVWERRDPDDSNTAEIVLYAGGSETALTSNGYPDYSPRISGSNVVWYGRPTTYDYHIFLFDGSTTTQLTTGTATNQWPDVSGSNVVWQGDAPGTGNTAIYLFDGTSTTMLTDPNDDHSSPLVSGSNVVWRSTQGTVNEHPIFLFDGSTTAQIGTGASFTISGTNVVWSHQTGGTVDTREIFLHDGAGQIQITNNDYYDESPHVSGANIVWTGALTGTYGYEVFTYQGGVIRQLTNNNLYEHRPRISGNVVVWWGGVTSDPNDDEIYLHDGTTKHRLTDNDYADGWPEISGSTVAWMGWDGNDWEIFMATGPAFPNDPNDPNAVTNPTYVWDGAGHDPNFPGDPNHAATWGETWSGDDPNWTASHWGTGAAPVIPSGSDVTVLIDGGKEADAFVYADGDYTIRDMVVDAGDELYIPSSKIFTVHGDGIVNNGTLTLDAAGGSSTSLILINDLTLSGTGTLEMSDTGGNRIYGGDPNEIPRLTVAAGQTISGAGGLGYNGLLRLTNEGTITADATAPLVIWPSIDGVVNSGLLQAIDGGTLRLELYTFDNAGGIIQALDGSTVQLYGLTVVGGTLTTSGSGSLQCIGNGPTLDGVTLTGTLTVLDSKCLTLKNTITNGGTLSVASAGSETDLILGSDVTLDGTGTLALSSSTQNRIYAGDAGHTYRLTVGVNQTVSGAGRLGRAGELSLTNAGTITADEAAPLVIWPNTDGVVNTGVLQASDGATLRLELNTFANTGGTIEALDGSTVELYGLAIVGGTLSTSGSGSFQVVGNGPSLDGVTLTGTLTVPNSKCVFLKNTITNEGTLNVSSAGSQTDLILGSDVMLGGSGTLAFSDSTQNRIYAGDAGQTYRLTVGADQTLAGTFNLGNGGQMALTNNGTIIANGSVQAEIHANASGFTNAGTLRVDSGSTARIRAGYVQTAGETRIDGQLRVWDAAMDIQGGTVSGSGTLLDAYLALGSSATLSPGDSIGTLNVAHTIAFADGATYAWEISDTASDLVVVTGDLTFGASAALNVSWVGDSLPADGDYVLFQVSGSIDTMPTWTINLPPGWECDGVIVDGNSVVLDNLHPVLMYTLGLTVNGEARGHVEIEPNDPNWPPFAYPPGTSVTLTAVPVEGKSFKWWKICDPNKPDDPNYETDANLSLTLVMNDDWTVEAVFSCGGATAGLPLLAAGLCLGLLVAGRRRVWSEDTAS